MGKKVIITGATGMVGNLVLNYCLNHNDISEVVSLVRKSTAVDHPKLSEVIVSDFADYSGFTSEFENVDAAFCCIGVYTGAVDRDKFRFITIDIPYTFAQKVYQHSPNAKYCLLSGAGADRTEKSRMMFARDKGIVENKLSKIGFKAFHTFRPGYIYPVTPRDEPNFSYKLFRFLYPVLKPLMGKNSSIKSTELAQAMLNVALDDLNNTEVFENKDILAQL